MPETAWICSTCGVQARASAEPPDICTICADPRQYVPASGQHWTTMASLASGHRNSFHRHEPGLTGIGTEPHFAIGQRALLVRTAKGNVLWDCISLLDDATREIIEALGGIAAIAISHPHFHATMVDWSRAFGDAPIYVHAADRDSVARPDRAIRFWSGATETLLDGVTLINTGGHFDGAA
ncbi:MAG TPA: MBL fold metallo-hydrolase, partial [Acidiphilium sp.]